MSRPDNSTVASALAGHETFSGPAPTRSVLERAWSRVLRPALSRIAEYVQASSPLALSDQIARLRWQVPLLALLLVLAQQLHGHIFLKSGHEGLLFVTEVLLYGTVGPIFVWVALGWVRRKVLVKEAAERELEQAHEELLRLDRHKSFLLKVNQRLAEAADEDELASLALRLPGEIAPVEGAALVRFDDRQQPMPVEFHGQLDEAARRAWGRRLASPALQTRCAECPKRVARAGQPCPQLSVLPLDSVSQVVCLPLTRSGQEFGILSLYLPEDPPLSEHEEQLLRAATAEISIAFENARLRSRELTTLYEVNEAVHQRLGLDRLLEHILDRVMEASEAEAALLLLRREDDTLQPARVTGRWCSAGSPSVVEKLAAGAYETSEAIVAEVELAGQGGVTVLCAPMVTDSGCHGVIALGSTRPGSMLKRQMRLLSAIASQSGLLVENANLYARLEHQAILTERGRLGREMHDGLAQTLGFLKMRSQQIAHWLENDETERARESLLDISLTANQAYQDLRDAIDGLRAALSAEPDFVARLRQVLQTFQTRSGVAAELHTRDCPALTPPAITHLLHLVQEALSNIQKHAGASCARVELVASNDMLTMTIGDDGRGFDTADPAVASQHGLRIMRERADLLGAELQIWSKPGQGTRVTLEYGPISTCPSAS